MKIVCKDTPAGGPCFFFVIQRFPNSYKPLCCTPCEANALIAIRITRRRVRGITARFHLVRARWDCLQGCLIQAPAQQERWRQCLQEQVFGDRIMCWPQDPARIAEMARQLCSIAVGTLRRLLVASGTERTGVENEEKGRAEGEPGEPW